MLTPPAIGGRFGPRRTESSLDKIAKTGLLYLLASDLAASGAYDSSFDPKAPPLANGVEGSPSGSHQAESVSKYPGSTQLVLRTASHSPGGSSIGETALIVVRLP